MFISTFTTDLISIRNQEETNTTATLPEFVAADVSPLIHFVHPRSERTHVRCYNLSRKIEQNFAVSL